ncbi:MAG: glycerophosphoryl diester phosphodiesterase membrane domain-containing protein [Terracidiphilus sp.]
MMANLRLMNLGEILDRTLQIYRGRFLLFVTLAAFPALVMTALQFANLVLWKLIPEPFGRPILLGMTAQNLLYMLVLYQAALLLHLLVWPAFAYLTSRLYLGEETTLGSAIFWCVARWRSWIWLTAASWGSVLVLPELVITGLLIGFIYLLEEVIKVGNSTMDSLAQPVVLAGTALGWAVFLWLSSALSFALPAWTLENLTVGKALRRSWMLSKGSRLKITFTRFMTAFVAWFLNVSIARILFLLIFMILRNQAGWWRFSRSVYMGGGLLTAAAVSAVIGPIFPIALTLFYYDQRMRREGYDIERMMDAAGLVAPVPSLVAGDPAQGVAPKEAQA